MLKAPFTDVWRHREKFQLFDICGSQDIVKVSLHQILGPNLVKGYSLCQTSLQLKYFQFLIPN